MNHICDKCGKPIAPSDRWHFVHRRFLWWHWRRREHRDCLFPTMGAAPVKMDTVKR